MHKLSIDAAKCTGDGICVAVCPMLLFTMQDGKAQSVPKAGEACIACGQCMAACPTGAIRLDGLDPEELEPVESGIRLSPDFVDHFLMTRRSVRAFTAETLPREKLEELLDVVRWAPTATNRQEVRWIMVEKPEDVRKVATLTMDMVRHLVSTPSPDISPQRAAMYAGLVKHWDNGVDIICRGAPHLALAVGSTTPPLRVQDGTIAVTYLELAAHGRRMGTCWAGWVTAAAAVLPKLREFLGLKDDEAVYGGLMLGWPKFRLKHIPARFEAEVQWI